MSDEFKRQNVIDNLMTLVQNSPMKVGEIEKKLGVSAGYLSRLKKQDNESALSAEFLWKISHVFGISVDTLVNERIGQEDKMIAYMRKFISKLSAKTSSGELIWNPITIYQINEMLLGKSKPQFPVVFYRNALFPKAKPERSNDPIRADYTLSCFDKMKVVSAVYGGILVNPQTSVYYTKIGEDKNVKELYLACYCTETENGAEEFLELMFVDPVKEKYWWDNLENDIETTIGTGEIPPYVEEVCNTFTNGWYPIKNEMRDLFRVVGSHEDDIQLAGSVKSTIDQFMNDGTDELPW